MKRRSLLIIVLLVVLAATTLVLADNGQIHRRNVSRTPEGETEDALISVFGKYIPAQSADGELISIEYYDFNDVLIDTRASAKPLVTTYIDGIGEASGAVMTGPQMLSGVGFGTRDAFAALSLDDGSSWQTTNLSRSADESSFILSNGEDYPGDAVQMVHAVAGNNVLAAWLSKYCAGGEPAYAAKDDLGVQLYPDLFGVAGDQKSVDYTLQGFPEVGEIPYSCLWTARGTLQLVDEAGDPDVGPYEILWRQPERLTSGRRDANRIEVAGAVGAGFIAVWQEDPDGLKPGQGLGPGEGWSGAIVNHKTDIWYSYIPWGSDFADAAPPDDNEDGRPKVVVPFSVPIRLTDNNFCNYVQNTDDEGNIINPYCYEDFNEVPGPDFCESRVLWENPGGTILQVCKAEDGRVLNGRVGASRPRIGLMPYTKGDGTTGAWVTMAYEESKGLGDESDLEEEIDIGKNVWYHSFEMTEPDMVSRGNMLNQPASDPATGLYFTDLYDELEVSGFFDTEIARRFSIIVQSADKVGDSGTVLVALFKQGIINQGGPADIFMRQFKLPDDFEPTTDNPYLFENMVCDNWNTDYPIKYADGVCMDPPANLSSPNAHCETFVPDSCPLFTEWVDGEPVPKVVTWEQTADNLDDQSWENPYDVAKGHRGFIDGDFIMLMYAWSPNWNYNRVGHDKYNLYVRRSFDGGETWTTTPGALFGDGTRHCENYLDLTLPDEGRVCTDYTAGEFEQARNVSQLTGTRVTVLDPRYSPTPKTILDVQESDYDPIDRNPSFYFVVYETGDNTTVAEGEATPLDLFYSRAFEWGDEYYTVDKIVENTGEVVQTFDWIEVQKDDLSSEASIRSNPGGTYLYAVWNQWNEDTEEVISNSDAHFRRVFFNDVSDSEPTTTLLWKSTIAGELGDSLTFTAIAQDNDQLGDGIVDFKWRSSLDGFLSDQKSFTIDADELSLGIHEIFLSACDDEGNWTPEMSTLLLVAEEVTTIHMPFSAR